MAKNLCYFFHRCTRFRFGPLNAHQILPRLKYVAEQESVKVTEDGEKALITLAQGDMRKVSTKSGGRLGSPGSLGEADLGPLYQFVYIY